MKKNNGSKLKIIPLGGLEQIGMNITVFEYEDSIIVVDCGLAFPEDDMLGIDLVIPDVTYLKENIDKVKGFVITHGHEDHIGALPYILKEVNVPVYATKLTIGLIENKLKEHNLLRTTKRKIIKHGQSINLGAFRIEFIKTNHSIADAAADDKIDLFLVEADYALKYVDTDYTMAVKDLGITDADLADQYQYTKDIVTDSNGVLKGVSWQGCPGVLFYNREAAKEVLGSDDPADVQEYVKDWDTFNDTAAKLKDAGYKITSSANDSYRVYSNNVSSKWVTDGKITIDDNIMKWVDDSKELVDAGETSTAELWSDDWKKGFYPEGKVFCYFGPAWLVNFSMAAEDEGSIANLGGWGATQGPQGFFWGGTWICAANGTDNPSLVKDIMLQMTTNADIMKDIVVADDDFVNNKTTMEAMAEDTSYSSKVLGGQNPLAMYCAGVDGLDLSNLSAYDQGCNEEFQNAMKNYFEGNATKDEALDLFYKAVEEKYPELTH